MKARLPIPEELRRILSETAELQRAYLVGGCVRNWLMGEAVVDFDVEVYGLGYDRLVTALSRWGRTDLVGRSFGVVKLTTRKEVCYDFTVPRRDSKTGPGHKGFEAELDPDIHPREAASRRDYTINALMFDPRREETLDFFGGRADLDARILRHVSDAFSEDPLRVLRGLQLAGRFRLSVAPETATLCRSIADRYGELALERVWEEWRKWAAQSRQPSCGLRFLVDTGWLEHYPELVAMIGTAQDREWHPEGDVFVHTCHCCDALAELEDWRRLPETSRATYMLAVLAHDLGKPLVTHEAERRGRRRIVSPGHEEAGIPETERFLDRIHAPRGVRQHVLPLVAHHLAHLQTETERAVRRLARRLEPETIEGLVLVMKADHFGRPPKAKVVPETITRLLELAERLALKDAAPKPILKGRHLVELGLEPGRRFGRLLAAAFEAQLEGEFHDLSGAWQWLLDESPPDLTQAARENLARLCRTDAATGDAS